MKQAVNCNTSMKAYMKKVSGINCWSILPLSWLTCPCMLMMSAHLDYISPCDNHESPSSGDLLPSSVFPSSSHPVIKSSLKLKLLSAKLKFSYEMLIIRQLTADTLLILSAIVKEVLIKQILILCPLFQPAHQILPYVVKMINSF